MGIPSQIATLILREHSFRPITGRLLSIGKQTVSLNQTQAGALIDRELHSASRVGASTEVDVTTRAGQGRKLISDRAFYSMFTDVQYSCLDFSAYEGADLVHDLCRPIPDVLAESFDFIIDGSCLDNIFDPATAIRNLARLLRPGGRIIQWNRNSRRHNVYVAFSMSWFHDFYAVNNFEDCQIYLAQWDGARLSSRWDFYHYEPVREQDGNLKYFGQDQYMFPWRDAHTVVIAQKGKESSWSNTPVQFEYRSQTKTGIVDGRREILPQNWPVDGADPYVSAAARFYRRARPSLLHSEEKIALPSLILNYSPSITYCGSLMPIGE